MVFACALWYYTLFSLHFFFCILVFGWSSSSRIIQGVVHTHTHTQIRAAALGYLERKSFNFLLTSNNNELWVFESVWGVGNILGKHLTCVIKLAFKVGAAGWLYSKLVFSLLLFDFVIEQNNIYRWYEFSIQFSWVCCVCVSVPWCWYRKREQYHKKQKKTHIYKYQDLFLPCFGKLMIEDEGDTHTYEFCYSARL